MFLFRSFITSVSVTCFFFHPIILLIYDIFYGRDSSNTGKIVYCGIMLFTELSYKASFIDIKMMSIILKK